MPTQTPSSSPPDAAEPALLPRASPSRSMRASRNSRVMKNVRDFMRPDRLREFMSTMALVAPLTVLIWIWAEREQAVQVPDKKTFAISVRSSNPTKTVSLAPGETDTVVVELSGPRAGVDGIKDAIVRDAAKSRLTVDVGDIFEPGGPYPIVLDSLIDQQKIFRDFGVSVHATDPPKVMVVVDRQVERELPVKLPAALDDGVQTTTTDPKTVKVRGPERTIKQLEASGALKAELDIANLGDASGRAGPKIDLHNVPLRPIEGAAGVTFDTTSIASVSLGLSQDEQFEIKSMVVYVNKPAALDVHVTVTPVVLTGVKVIGPSDALRMLREEKAVPTAVITITRDDRGVRSGSRVPTVLNLPAGARVIPASVSPVTFDVLEQSATSDVQPIP